MSWLDAFFFGVKNVASNAVLLTQRQVLNFKGTNITTNDNPATQMTDVTVSSSSVGGWLASTRPPLVASLTWVNQGSATAADSADSGFDIVSPPNENANNLHCLVQTAPAAPYTWTIGVLIDPPNGFSNANAGIVWRESATGKLITFVYDINSSGQLVNWKYSDVTTQVTHYSITNYNGSNDGIMAPLWLQIHNDGTNLFWRWSNSGRFFLSTEWTGAEVGHAKNDFFTTGPNQFGVVVNAPSAQTPPIAMHVFSWATTTP